MRYGLLLEPSSSDDHEELLWSSAKPIAQSSQPLAFLFDR